MPKVDWTRTSARVMTTEWIEAIPIADLAAIDRAGIDRSALGNHVIRSFLRHAMRDGFFHADMHQGNLFVEPAGTLVAVDFGIMGRLGPKEKRFLAEILYGFLTRDYRRTAQMHLDAGYVPAHHSVEAFAQALRSIGEPLMDRTAEEISMARLLSQLFEVTELFDMQTRPELLLLQKTMVVVEGVARSLDPRLNIWTAAEPVVKGWMEEQIGPRARLNEAAQGVSALGGPRRRRAPARRAGPPHERGLGGGGRERPAPGQRHGRPHGRGAIRPAPGPPARRSGWARWRWRRSRSSFGFSDEGGAPPFVGDRTIAAPYF